MQGLVIRLLYHLPLQILSRRRLTSSVPADDATVAEGSNIVLNFSEAVDVATGNIVFFKTSDNSVVETFDVSNSNLI